MAGEIADYGAQNNTDVWILDETGTRQRATLTALGGYTKQPKTSAFNDASVSQFEPLTGWTFAYNINPAIVEVTEENGGTVTTGNSSAILTTGADPAGRARIETVRSSRYIPGVGAIARFTALFDTPQADSVQIIGIGNGVDGWFFGYNGLQFGILRLDGGVENWTYQDDWSHDQKPDLDPTKGNVYEIKYQWLGYGMQYFNIENDEGDLTVVHRIKYSNLFTTPSIDNPNLPLSAMVRNDGNTIPITMETPSSIAGLDGFAFNDALSVNTAGDFIGSVAAGSEIPIISFRMAEAYKTKANRLFAQALRLSFATEGAKPVIFRFYVNATVVGGTWVYINEEQSPLEQNKTITSITPGNPIGTFGLGKSDSYPVDLTASFFRLYAGQNITVTAETTSTATEVVFSMNWKVFV
jgi:hypothetical protein